MVSIVGGTFLMGSPEGEGYGDEKPQHQVTIEPFYMGKYPVTQAQWLAVMGKNLSRFKDGNWENRPVEEVSWDDAVAFCEKLSKLTGNDYRLPSEAEWEYGCRAGTTTPFYFGETITTDLANYRGTDWERYGWSGSYGSGPKGVCRSETTEVGKFPPNAFGLYEQHGNVWEWCGDNLHENYEGAPTDGSVWKGGNESRRVLRGGSWGNYPVDARAASRNGSIPDDRNVSFGFRVVRRVART
jgi:formylglycine-generating enzyme required for sulfatase activity